MKKISLSLKLSISYVVVSIVTLYFFYYIFYNLFEQHMLKVEREKAMLIAQTIEPLVAMRYYLGLNDDIEQLASKTAEHDQVVSLSIEINDEIIWSKLDSGKKKSIKISYPVTSLLENKKIGLINIAYTKDSLNSALQQIHNEILYFLAVLALVFVVYVSVVRHLFSPFGRISQKVKNYSPGSAIDFSSIHGGSEVDSIVSAFENMVSNIREYTVLLERYKHSVDESAIVVRMDLEGIITYVNEEFCRLSGYNVEESLGASIFTICHLDADNDQCNEIIKTAQSRKIWKGNLQNHRKNGSSYYVRVTVVPILDEKDNIVELISIQQDITQVIEQQEQIVRQTMDVTTGLSNRVKLEEDIAHIVEPKFAIISLDNYSVIKDYYGWASGKKILKEVAQIFLSVTSIENITVYKLAGSDYAILGSHIFDMGLFHGICRTVLEKINNYSIQLDEGTINIGASAGLTSNKDHLLSYAGLALQHAQETSHLTVIYEETENLVQQFENNLIWTKKLNLALKENRIVLFVQPILNAKLLKIEKYECLVRMIDEDREKVVLPFFFLDVAKKSKLYHQLTERVINISFDIFSQVPDVDFSINLALDDILHVPTVKLIESRLNKTGLASRFVIEIVETEGIEDIKEVFDFVADMKARGCKIAIDDFGSGYSNFAYLMKLNVDYIKIDGSLIKSIDQDINSQIITSTILDFSQQLNISTVAEYVHNQAVLDYVQKLGIDYVQGFHLGEPVPIETLIGK